MGPAAFVGTGDLFTALSTAWLTKSGGDLKIALEKTIGTMQAVLARTMKHANAAAASAGLEKATAAMMELKLIQSREEILNPSTKLLQKLSVVLRDWKEWERLSEHLDFRNNLSCIILNLYIFKVHLISFTQNI